MSRLSRACIGSKPLGRSRVSNNRKLVLAFLLLLLFLVALPPLANPILELLPQTAIQPVTKLAEIVHLTPAIASPLATRHIDEEVALALLVMHTLDAALLRFVRGLERSASASGEAAVVAASALRESVDAALRDESSVGADPGLVGVDVFEGVLFFVLPLHVALFVEDGVPPDVEQAVGPGAAADEERAEIEAAAVLGYDQVDALREAVACCAGGERVEVVLVLGCFRIAGRAVGWVLDFQRVVNVDIAVCGVA